MKAIVQITAKHLKKIMLTGLLAACCWMVQAGDWNSNSPFEYPVKLVKCYPNPATSFINFDFNEKTEKFFSLQIYSFTGKKMADESVKSSKITITLGDEFYRGLYIYRLVDIRTGKIIDTGKFQVAK